MIPDDPDRWDDGLTIAEMFRYLPLPSSSIFADGPAVLERLQMIRTDPRAGWTLQLYAEWGIDGEHHAPWCLTFLAIAGLMAPELDFENCFMPPANIREYNQWFATRAKSAA